MNLLTNLSATADNATSNIVVNAKTGMPWAVPRHLDTALNPTQDLQSRRQAIVQEGGTELGTKLAEHREALDALIPVLEEWDTQLGTFVTDIAVAIEEEHKALQRIEEILAHLSSKKETNDANAESFSQAQYAIRLTEKITATAALKETATTKVVGLSTMREQAMEQRTLMVSRATLVEQEIVATSGLIRADLRRAVAAARQDAATTPESSADCG